MAARETHYDILGVPRDAKLTDIGRAYNRFKAEMQRETWAPDARKEARIHEAYAVLSDPAQRDAYDASLVVHRRPLSKAQIGAFGILAVILAAGVGFWAYRPVAPVAALGRAQHDILAEAARSVGRVKSIDISGNSAQAGIAFTIEEGVMATICEGLPAGAQLVVAIAPRSIAARMGTADEELGVCKLAVDGSGSWPLPISNAEPRVGERVFAASVNAAGEVSLTEGAVKRILAAPKARFIEVTVPLAPDAGGGPLLDTNGRVVGIATVAHSEGKPLHMAVPAAWILEARGAARPAAAPAGAEVIRPAAPDAAASSPQDIQLRVPGSGAKTKEERREELQKAFRPPPNVPDDLENIGKSK